MSADESCPYPAERPVSAEAEPKDDAHDNSEPAAAHAGPVCVIYAYRIDGKGGAQPLDVSDYVYEHEGGVAWFHADANSPERVITLLHRLGVSTRTATAMSRTRTRPTFFVADEGIVLILRGVNLNPGARPDDMVALRMLVTPRLVVTLRHRRMLAVGDIKRRLARGAGPTGAGRFIADLVECTSGRMEPVIEELMERLDELDDRLDRSTCATATERVELSDIRHQSIRLRRYIAPQRDLLARLLADAASGAHPIIGQLLGQDERAVLHESADRFARFVEDLDLIQQRSALTSEEIAQQQTARVNRSLFILSVISLVFVPVSAITSLLGVNLGGIPLADSPIAFAVLCGILVVVIAGEIAILARLFK